MKLTVPTTIYQDTQHFLWFWTKMWKFHDMSVTRKSTINFLRFSRCCGNLEVFSTKVGHPLLWLHRDWVSSLPKCMQCKRHYLSGTNSLMFSGPQSSGSQCSQCLLTNTQVPLGTNMSLMCVSSKHHLNCKLKTNIKIQAWESFSPILVPCQNGEAA